MSEGKKYGLILPNKTAKSKAVVNRLSVFADDDDVDQEENTGSALFPVKDTKKIQIKRQTQLEMEKAIAVDPTVYEYDTIYDDLQAKKAMSDKRLASDVEHKPKYIDKLLKAAGQRKRDLERRIEKTVQKEREAEKGLYDDKEAFVTGAYRSKMEQLRQEEERERKQEELEARMDVTKQEDMSAFYRNLLDQTTDSTVKVEPAQTDDTTSVDERSHKPAATAVTGDEDDTDDSSSSSSSSGSSTPRSPRKCGTQESPRNRNTDRKDVHHHHRTTSGRSSSNLDERHHSRDGHRHRKHDTDNKHATGDADLERKQSSETSTGKSSCAVDISSRKDLSDQGHMTESKYRSKQTDETSGANSRKLGESSRQETESGKKRKQSGSTEDSSGSKLNSSSSCINSDDASSKPKHAKSESNQMDQQAKTAKQTVGAAFDSARARFLARKGKSSAPVVCEDSD